MNYHCFQQVWYHSCFCFGFRLRILQNYIEHLNSTASLVQFLETKFSPPLGLAPGGSPADILMMAHIFLVLGFTCLVSRLPEN